MRLALLFITLTLIQTSAFSQKEPPLKPVLDQLGFTFHLAQPIRVQGPLQGLFVKTRRKVEVLLVAKYSFGKEETLSDARVGYYLMQPNAKLRLLFECGPEAGDKESITGLTATPRGPYKFDPGNRPFAFYVQSASFNPSFTKQGETVSTQDSSNATIKRFGFDTRKARIYPYQTKHGIKKDWYVICWEFSTNNDFQDLITIVRGVRLATPLREKSQSDAIRVIRQKPKQTISMREITRFN